MNNENKETKKELDKKFNNTRAGEKKANKMFDSMSQEMKDMKKYMNNRFDKILLLYIFYYITPSILYDQVYEQTIL